MVKRLSHQDPETRLPGALNLDRVPDVRDGLTREQRVILYTLHEAQQELGQRNVPTLMLYGRVVERVNMSKEHFYTLLQGLVGRGPV